MSFDTEKRKLRTIWEGCEEVKNYLDSVTLIQGKRVAQIALYQPKTVQFNNFYSVSSNWVPIAIRSLQEIPNDSTFDYKAISFIVEQTLPNAWVP